MDEPRDTTADLRTRSLVRGAVIHIVNEQPLLADLFGYPSPADVTLVCTNLRGTTGKRPIWADDTHSVFYFPWAQIRFLEILPDRSAPPPADETTAIALRPADEPDEEIDEDFLRRVRDV